MLLWAGDKCWITTNAIPLSAGIASKKLPSASKPPADAPRPTTKEGGAGFTFLFVATRFPCAFRGRNRFFFFRRPFDKCISGTAFASSTPIRPRRRFSTESLPYVRRVHRAYSSFAGRDRVIHRSLKRFLVGRSVHRISGVSRSAMLQPSLSMISGVPRPRGTTSFASAKFRVFGLQTLGNYQTTKRTSAPIVWIKWRQAGWFPKRYDTGSSFCGGGFDAPEEGAAAFLDFMLRQIESAALCECWFHIQLSSFEPGGTLRFPLGPPLWRISSLISQVNSSAWFSGRVRRARAKQRYYLTDVNSSR
jgi:hypothetical protein